MTAARRRLAKTDFRCRSGPAILFEIAGSVVLTMTFIARPSLPGPR
jgi:hypothetical protein